MEHYHQKETALHLIPVNYQDSTATLLEECRDLVHHLGKKTESLYRECRYDRNKAIQIRTIGSTLAALTDLVNRLEQQTQATPPSQILKDAQGISYESVRSCDLDRICDK